MKKITPFFTAILAFCLGALWYSEYLLGGLWKEAVSTANNGSMALPMAISFVLMIIIAYSMRWLMGRAKVPASYQAGLTFGAMIAILFVCTSLGIVYVYSGKENWLIMWAIDAGYQTAFLMMMGSILAVW